MASTHTIRPAVAADTAPAYAMFRRSIYGYLATIGLADAATAANPPVASAWQRQSGWITHLWNTAHQNWVACDDEGKVIGWSLSTLRGSHLELCLFFVDPAAQGGKIGAALLGRTFAAGPGIARSIVATQDPRALGLYLRTGVAAAGTSVDFIVPPWTPDAPVDLTFERLAASAAAVEEIGQIDDRVLGFRRDIDIAFLLKQRPAWLARRKGAPAGYVFGIQPNPPGVEDVDPVCGPAAALDPADMPALLDRIVTEPGDALRFAIALPFANREAIGHLLKHGAQIDPFYVSVLCDAPGPKLDRYVHTAPSFIL